jgi:PQQ enzyme repeat
MSPAVTTRSYDNARSGTNPEEAVLTPAAVGTRGIKRLFSLQMTGDARGIEAQPLVLPGVTLADGQSHDVVYLADMANQVWAFDADTGARLWTRKIGPPVNGTRDIDHYPINDHWGILSTPVIDEASGTIYLVAWISPDGSAGAAKHYCYAVSSRDGTDVYPPVNLEGLTYQAGHGAPEQRFASAGRKQRAALLMTTVNGVKTVFIGFGSLQETSDTARGWVIACAAAPLAPTAAWASTAKGFGGGIWQGAAGLAADAEGFVYCMTGNGTFDGEVDFAESFVKLRYAPPAGPVPGSLSVTDWWTPFTDAARTDPGAGPGIADLPLASNYRAATGGMGGNPWSDQDLGSAGPLLVEPVQAVIGAGKDGVVYVLHQGSMGKTGAGDLANPARNYQKLMAPPIFFTYYPPALNPAPQDIRALNVWYDNQTHHLHGGPVYWDSPDLGRLVYCWGENGNLRAWSLNGDGVLTYLACSAEWASPDSPDDPGGGPKGGMPGGMISLSANGTQPHAGVVWALVPYADANMAVVAGRLLAYDATEFGTFGDGSKQLRVLWDSQDWNIQFSYNKFNRPVVFNGKLFVPTYDDRVDVYGLA